MIGLVIFAHGSPVESANEPVRVLAREVAVRGEYELVEPAFLDCADPDLAGAVQRLVKAGAKRVIVVPFFLTLGLHLKRDLPRIVGGLQDIYNSVTIEVAAPLEGHPALVDALLDRAKDVMHGGGGSESTAG